eukprot:5232993-Alexandrium_andersonii.AAC.1
MISGLRIAAHIAPSRGGLRPPDPPEKRLWRARRPISSLPSGSACKMTPTAPDGAFQDGM